MDGPVGFELDAEDLIAQVMAEMEEVLDLIRRPTALARSPGVPGGEDAIRTADAA